MDDDYYGSDAVKCYGCNNCACKAEDDVYALKKELAEVKKLVQKLQTFAKGEKK